MDRLSSMSIFVKAVEFGSFSAAADALNMSPQLVGKHVQFLEQHLGIRLLNRTTRRQHLTEVGSQFYERCRNILAEVESAEALAAETRAVPRGKLKVNAPVSFGIHALTPKLSKYLGAHPEVSIELSLSNRLVDLIDEGYDAVFRVGELVDSGLIARRLDPYRLVICAAPSYLRSRGLPSKPDDLKGHDCLIFSHTMLRRYWDFEGPEGSVNIPISGRLMIDSGEALLQAALAGLGIILQPYELVRSGLETGSLVSILPEYRVPVRSLHILHAPDRRITPKLRSFLDFVSSEFGGRGSA
ncbi:MULTISPECIES: LysR family transcriptional regulator [unclassified Rhizobium]|jgi:DNA-binding transcriptional LysR family regulator|uniref:LysR family transcriptional regulator n=1 Tax=unclassified Rhizobium TaxID=2613769 RepID=UPI00064584F0|nr:MULTISPECIES: LysR family transcriptional regulator [unclassified Rhizobium]MBN8951888.1 LysR family transcriptional regulator [Rhizobium tropici]OJY73874.1 MAG: LysR family transcriptional regulator [Rhizobium sp. 60-20]RKD61838.1 DNA-binding transcriptional LysR family regulator [Rhizobium sp. WW_1]